METLGFNISRGEANYCLKYKIIPRSVKLGFIVIIQVRDR